MCSFVNLFGLDFAVQQDDDLNLKIVSVISLVYCIFIFISFDLRINSNKMVENLCGT